MSSFIFFSSFVLFCCFVGFVSDLLLSDHFVYRLWNIAGTYFNIWPLFFSFFPLLFCSHEIGDFVQQLYYIQWICCAATKLFTKLSKILVSSLFDIFIYSLIWLNNLGCTQRRFRLRGVLGQIYCYSAALSSLLQK